MDYGLKAQANLWNDSLTHNLAFCKIFFNFVM